MGGNARLIDFTPQQINKAKDLFEGIKNGDKKSYSEFRERFTEGQQEELFRQRILVVPKNASKAFKELVRQVVEATEKKALEG
ncbi:MAG: hypothetical protein ACREBF_02160 [Candidatus Micrarchaeales archaeon]